jgi:predicted RNA-binding Zn-ribbon protein involved in translation (DUF1610 family)
MKACPECGSNKVYRHKKATPATGAYGPILLPNLNPGWFNPAKMTPVVCKSCGLIRFYATKETLEILEESNDWELNF